MWIQAGVAIFGERCNNSDYPEVYSRVSDFQRWIEAEVMGGSVGFKTFTSNQTNPDDTFVCPNSSTAAALTWVFIVISITYSLAF